MAPDKRCYLVHSLVKKTLCRKGIVGNRLYGTQEWLDRLYGTQEWLDLGVNRGLFLGMNGRNTEGQHP